MVVEFTCQRTEMSHLRLLSLQSWKAKSLIYLANNLVRFISSASQSYKLMYHAKGCLACCEVIKHPNVRFGTSKANQKYADPGILVDGESQLPPGYIVASQADHVLTRFVLVYTESTSPQTQRRSYNVCLYLFLIYIISLLFLWISRDKRLIMSLRYTFKL